ncbi:hypothetical protein ABT040_33775 [Streptomyces sp. NPDC002688]|uniref:hypothetical protein n=1 Tax=Streptomyces sp. NPDC002688 TaxID=3154423 RepID=UPI003326313B
MAAAETDPSAVTASGTLGIPAQYVGASQDGIADNQQKMYDAKSGRGTIDTVTVRFDATTDEGHTESNA